MLTKEDIILQYIKNPKEITSCIDKWVRNRPADSELIEDTLIELNSPEGVSQCVRYHRMFSKKAKQYLLDHPMHFCEVAYELTRIARNYSAIYCPKTYDFSMDQMLGKTIKKIDKGDLESKDDSVVFLTENEMFVFTHFTDCCESVYLDDICGDLSDLLDSPLIEAEEVSSCEGQPSPESKFTDDYDDESETWTFYKFATAKGCVTLRWYGTSNGYYSESVDRFMLKLDEF